MKPVNIARGCAEIVTIDDANLTPRRSLRDVGSPGCCDRDSLDVFVELNRLAHALLIFQRGEALVAVRTRDVFKPTMIQALAYPVASGSVRKPSLRSLPVLTRDGETVCAWPVCT